MIEEVEFDGRHQGLRQADFELMSRQMREGIDDQHRRWEMACNRVSTASAKLERSEQERDELRKKIAAIELAVHSEDQTLELLRMQQDAAASRNADLAEKENQEAKREQTARELYVRQLFEQASSAYNSQRVLSTLLEDRYEQLQQEVMQVMDRLGEAGREMLDCLRDNDGVARKLWLDDADADQSSSVPSSSSTHPVQARGASILQFLERHSAKLEAIIQLNEHLKVILAQPMVWEGAV